MIRTCTPWKKAREAADESTEHRQMKHASMTRCEARTCGGAPATTGSGSHKKGVARTNWQFESRIACR
eukprot:7391639-Prymnesium_polylepis.1